MDEIDRRLRRITRRLEGASALMYGRARRKEKTNQEFLDTAGVVIALGKDWKRRNRHETVKLLNGIQRV
jgi:hypothetical protein